MQLGTFDALRPRQYFVSNLTENCVLRCNRLYVNIGLDNGSVMEK